MTVEELQNLRDEILTKDKERLSKDGSIDAYFILVLHDGKREIYAVLGTSINDPDFKTSLARKIRERVARGDVAAVVFVSDIFWTDDLTPKNEKIRRTLGLNAEQSAATGLCTKHEAIMLQIETPIILEITRQEYRRDGTNIEFVGSPRTERAGEHYKVMPSKMARWFPKTEAGRA